MGVAHLAPCLTGVTGELQKCFQSMAPGMEKVGGTDALWCWARRGHGRVRTTIGGWDVEEGNIFPNPESLLSDSFSPESGTNCWCLWALLLMTLLPLERALAFGWEGPGPLVMSS